jgi:HSP20 family protein
MNTLVKRNNDLSYDPFMDFYNMESFFPSFLGQTKSFPSVNISEDDKSYCLDVVAPGFNKDDFKINVENDMLTISAEAKSEYNDNDEAKNNNQNSNQESNKNTKNQQKSNGNTGSNGNDSNGSNNQRQYSRREYTYSSFTRTFRLPENTNDDNIAANYKDGILKISIPKSKQEQKATKQIDVK